ncbi:APG6-domain-containing protein [Coniophora puteana RWD-64-598 SS2]|uniref:APG6-domain-containing protein n=1 Tax=Coniophora puteana (strain RWD-64-598) TaxID=741705 RepID=A0A5M3MVM2_CONPW|nr:APG6-domain-containing protein [Coniophora puteana RWD-64-598 SS2]EIW83067.1 APG6-domain-containing protein [Coniophora puteana RWD-64-598 SS2]
MAFVCQQCKEALHLDASLVDLTPSAYDMIGASLPSAPPSPARYMSEAEQLAHLPSSSAVKNVWQHSKHSSHEKPTTSHSSRPRDRQSQRVHLPPNESFVLLQESVLNDLPAPSSAAPMAHQNFSPRGNGKVIAQDQQSSLLGPDHPSPTPISHHLRSSLRLFSLLSTRTDIDHPLCAECAHILLASLQRQLDETKKERDGYIAFEKEVKKERERESSEMPKDEVEKKIEKLVAEERVAIDHLRQAELEREQLDEELRILEHEEKLLAEEETDFWRGYNEQLLASADQASQLASLRAAYAADYATLEKLERANVYNDAFCIGHDGVFGTINGLRLGRVPGVPQVEWSEVNAAWGQTLLLLYTIARKLDYSFETYRLVPMGSFSRIEKVIGDKAIYELYASSELHLGRLLHNRRFDLAMVAFLDCLKQLVDYVKSQEPSLEFPHQISKDKIGEASVKLQFNQEEAWTRALRHVLLALKIVLKWTTNGGNG